MSFMTYDLIFLALFTLGVVWFLTAKRDKLGKEGIIFLYRTKIGLKIIDNIGKKYKRTLKFLSYIIVASGYFLMGTMMYLLLKLVPFFASAENVQLVKIPPLIPLIPYLPTLFKIEWLPPLYFTYWILILAVVAIVHEGAHGIYARYNGIKVKSTGFGFLGPILTFFVEPDEKQIEKSKIFPQLSILGAGVFANVLTAIVFFFIMLLFFTSFYTPTGALFNTYSYSLIPMATMAGASITNNSLAVDGVNLTQVIIEDQNYFVLNKYLEELDSYEEGSILAYQDHPAIKANLQGAITKINDRTITSHDDIREELNDYKPGDKITINTKDKDSQEEFNYEIVLGEDYEQPGRPIIGIGVLLPETRGIRGFLYNVMNTFRNPSIVYEPTTNSDLIEFIYYLFWWMILVNLGVALFNILPLGITDGGRYWYLTMLAITKNKKFAMQSYKFITGFILFIFILLMVLWAFGIA